MRPEDGEPPHDIGAGLKITQRAIAAVEGVGGERGPGDGAVRLRDVEGLDTVVIHVDGRVGIETVVAANQSGGEGRERGRDAGQHGDRGSVVRSEGTGLRAVGEGDDLRRGIPRGAAASFPLCRGVARGNGVRATVVVAVTLGGGANRRILEGARKEGGEFAVDVLGGGLALKTLALVYAGDPQRKFPGQKGYVDVETLSMTAVAVEPRIGAIASAFKVGLRRYHINGAGRRAETEEIRVRAA